MASIRRLSNWISGRRQTNSWQAAPYKEQPKARERIEAILRGLLHCEACGTPMVPAYTKRNAVRVRYYTCLSAQKRGWKTCPSRSLPAHVIEAAVLERLDHARPESVAGLVERIGYDGRTRQVSILLRRMESAQ